MTEERPSSSPSKKSWLERVTDVFTGEPKDRKDLKGILTEAYDNNILDKEAFRIIEGALNVSEMHVREITIPRSHMVVIEAGQGVLDMLADIVKSGHSRFPVMGEKPDEIVGILLAKDLLRLGLLTKFDEELMTKRLKEIIRPATFIPESKRLNILLNEFRLEKQHMAIVVDEYGGIAGLVTIEDVLEEIVGEIDDEHDDIEAESIRELDNGKHAVDALTPVEDFNEYFETFITDDEFDTIGGVVTHQFGHLPKRDENVVINGWEFRVLSADDRRLKHLEVAKIKTA